MPKGWLAITLGQVTSKPQYGYTTKSQTNGDVLYLRTTDLTSGKVDWETVPCCVDNPKDVSKYLLQDRDIVISRAGSVGFHLLLKSPPSNAVFASYLIRFKPSSFIDERYLSHFFNSKAYWSQITEKSAGVAVQNVNAKKLSDLKLPLAPLNEQRCIADKLDSILANVNRAQERLEKVPSILKRFRQSILSAATLGELTREWRELKENSEPWNSVQLIDVIVSKPRNGKSPRGVDFDTGIKNLTLSAITPGYFVENKFKFVALDVPDDSHLWVKSGDILIQRANSIEYVGVSALYQGKDNKYIYPDLIMKCRANNKILPKFLYYSLSSEIVRKYFRDNATGTTGNMPKINQSVVSTAPIELPSLAEQNEIVRRIESLFSLADIVEKQYSDAKARINSLTYSILAKAFRGELVSQDVNDEPASKLLEYIKVEQDNQKKKTEKPQRRSTNNGVKSAQQALPRLTDQPEENRTPLIAIETKDSLRLQYQEQIEKAQSTLKGAKFTVEQFRSVTDFKGDYDSFKVLVMNLLKGIPSLSEPLLEVDSWDANSGDYLLRLLEGK
nr:restriction endonuclease subunit S [Vibrio chagasii]